MSVEKNSNISVHIKNILIYTLSIYLCVKLYKLVYIYINDISNSYNKTYFDLIFPGININSITQALSHIVFAPIIETLIFITLVFAVLVNKIHKNIFVVMSSSILFASFHLSINLYTFGYTLLGGFILATYYSKKLKTYGRDVTTLHVVIIHSIYNTISIFA